MTSREILEAVRARGWGKWRKLEATPAEFDYAQEVNDDVVIVTVENECVEQPASRRRVADPRRGG
jgi:hypothetical protein